MRGPISVNSAGMITVRTTKVSSRMPRPTMMPIWVSTIRGSTPSTQNTAASTMPALVMTAPVAETARTMPVPGAVCRVSPRGRG